MSTTIVETWASNMADLGPIYPFVGSEVILYIAGLAFWIIFHIVQMSSENALYDKEQAHYQNKEQLQKALDKN